MLAPVVAVPRRASKGRWIARLLPAAVLLVSILAGCTTPAGPGTPYGARDDFGIEKTVNGRTERHYDTDGTDPNQWPDLEGVELVLLDNGAFSGFQAAADQFRALTGATVKLESGGDGVKAMSMLRTGRGTYDVVYGLDNMLVGMAAQEGLLQNYKPALASRIGAQHIFFPQPGDWPATPVDHGYIAINVDGNSTDLGGAQIRDLRDVRRYADQFVTQKPTLSTPGLGFLLITIATFGDATAPGSPPNMYDWHDYWEDLLKGTDTRRNALGQAYGCVAVVDDWKTAYEQYFSGGYGPSAGGKGNKAIVTSYTESPAYEHFNERPLEDLATVVLAKNSTFHQIQTMAIAADAPHLEAAQAWIEFSLTDFFQELAAPKNGVYPVVPGIPVFATYKGIDPTPGTFSEARFTYAELTQNIKKWQNEWTALYEQHNCARVL